MEAKQRERGTVKFFDENRGFGFIKRAFGRDVFLHASDLPEGVDLPAEGELVFFDVIEEKKGHRATRVRFGEDEDPQFRQFGRTICAEG